MKIAYLSTFYPYRGGIAQFNASLYRVFEKEHSISAYTFKRQYPDVLFPGKSQLAEAGDIADKIPAERLLDTINPHSYILTARRISGQKPDMLLMKYWMPFFAPSLGHVAGKLKKQGTKPIAILDNVIPHEKRPGDIALTKYFLSRCSGFVAMSKLVQSDLRSLQPSAKSIVMEHPLYDHFGAKTDRLLARKQLNIAPDKKVLLFFGFIRSYKGLDLLIDALAKLPEDYHLVIAGEVYGSFDDYQKQIERLNLNNRITIHTHYISDAETSVYFSAADACVLPYKSATQSGIIAITYHFDLPVIATDVGGLREMIEPRSTGLIVAEPTADMLAQGVLNYFEQNLKEQFSENIREYKTVCNWENFAKGIIDFYDTL